MEELSLKEIVAFELISKDWYEDFFASNVETVSVRNMTTRFSLRSQNAIASSEKDGRPFAENTITYDQTIAYLALDDAFTAKDYIELPFLSLQGNQDYAARLKEGIDAFRNVQTPLARPRLPTSSPYPTSSPSIMAPKESSVVRIFNRSCGGDLSCSSCCIVSRSSSHQKALS